MGLMCGPEQNRVNGDCSELFLNEKLNGLFLFCVVLIFAQVCNITFLILSAAY